MKVLNPARFAVLLCTSAWIAAGSAQAQVVPGHIVSVYATSTSPLQALSFDPSGVLYAGSSLAPDPVSIIRIGIGGSPVEEYGAAITDPDAVLFDAVGDISGTPGSVLVAGSVPVMAVGLGAVHAVRPDQSVITLFGPALPLKNPTGLAFLDSGNLLIGDIGNEMDHGMFELDPDQQLTTFDLPYRPSFIDTADGLVYVSCADGTIRVYDMAGAVVNAALATGLGDHKPLAVGPGNSFGTDLYAIDPVTSNLVRIARDGMSAPQTFGTGFNVGDIEFGPDGALYASRGMDVVRIVPDSDGDGLADEEDPCNNDGARNISIKPSLAVKKIGTDTTLANDGLLVKGEFVSATSFASLDPVADGARVLLLSDDDTVLADVAIPGGSLWTVTSKKLLFKDPEGTSGGITKFQVQNRDNKAPNQVKVQVIGKDGSYPVTAGQEPLRAIVVIGDGAAGECGETAFGSGDCEFNGSGNAVKCR